MTERKFDRLMNYRIDLRGIKFQLVDILFVICLFLFAFMVRLSLMPIESGDFNGFLKEWMVRIRMEGGFLSMGNEISNYAPAYMYLLSLISYSSYSDLHLIKFLSVFFDYIAGIAVFLITYKMLLNTRKAILAMSFFLLAPSVVMNGAYWAQCDVIYTAFILYAFYFLLQGDSKKVLLFTGIAFSFKLQALFFVPFLLILWLKGYVVRLRDFLLIPLVYVITILPSWLMGRDFRSLLFIYEGQAGYYPWGTLAYPNIYTLLGEAMPNLKYPDEVSGAGIWMSVILLGGLAYYLYGKRMKITYEFLITTALFSVSAVVYCLPHMHERYGFMVDAFAVIYGICNIKKIPVAVSFLLISLLSYMYFLIGVNIIPPEYCAIWLFASIIYVGMDLHRQIRKNLITPESNP